MVQDNGSLRRTSQCTDDCTSGTRGATGSERVDLTVEQILAWADAYQAEHGTWPVVGPLVPAEPVAGAPGESWKAINHALALGLRGLPGDSSLGELLAEHRGAPVPDMGAQALARKIWAWEQEQFPLRRAQRRQSKSPSPRCPTLTIDGILGWADAHRAATGRWPNRKSGRVRDAPFDVLWKTVNSALCQGHRGLPGAQSLCKLLDEHRGPVRRHWVPPWRIEQVLAWIDAYRAATGRWPRTLSGPVDEAPHITWTAINDALRRGWNERPGGGTLARFIMEHRGPAARNRPVPLTLEQVRGWMDAHRAATGSWPHVKSGPVRDVPHPETWARIDQALNRGNRGLPSGLSLARVRPDFVAVRPPLTIAQILAWADAHRAATGHWPKQRSGEVKGASGEFWSSILGHLRNGGRGLPGGQTLGSVLAEHRGARIKLLLTRLTVEQILAWADAHFAAHGVWARYDSGPIDSVPGETWCAIDSALAFGRRGLPGGTRLARLLDDHGRRRAYTRTPDLTQEQILAWADAHHEATGRWPTQYSGAVMGTPGETWERIHSAFHRGARSLPKGSSLPRLLEAHRGVRNHLTLPRLTTERIQAWAKAHHAAHGRWPSLRSGPVAAAPGETWARIDKSLSLGRRGLPGARRCAG